MSVTANSFVNLCIFVILSICLFLTKIRFVHFFKVQNKQILIREIQWRYYTIRFSYRFTVIIFLKIGGFVLAVECSGCSVIVLVYFVFLLVDVCPSLLNYDQDLFQFYRYMTLNSALLLFVLDIFVCRIWWTWATNLK